LGSVCFIGLVSFALGIMLLAHMPVSAVWFIGVAIGIDLISDGAAFIGLAIVLHRAPTLKTIREHILTACISYELN
jgi:uncharacterized membrane protein HdeD (DUF308 family)